MDHELAGSPVELKIKEWLSEWWKPILRGGWHAPIVLVENKVVSQGSALNRGVLTLTIIQAHAKKNSIFGNHLFGKMDCPHCIRGKKYLNDANNRFYLSRCGERTSSAL